MCAHVPSKGARKEKKIITYGQKDLRENLGGGLDAVHGFHTP